MERQVDANNSIKAGAPPQVPGAAASGAVANGAPDPEGKGRASKADIITAAIVAVVIGVVLWKLNVLSFVKVLLGLSFVIFIHEFGHFFVAKMCDVHVTHFSIGFGPVIPGCWFKWGETMYQICLLPLGGYVQMVGQVDGDESSDGSENDPRSYRNKSVGARMAIISAGVIMNVILALVIFIVVYRGPGKERHAARIGDVDAGGPAFTYGMRTGMDIQQIGDDKHPYFDDLRLAVGGSSAGEMIKIVALVPGSTEPVTIELQPRKLKSDANPVLGVTDSATTKFVGAREVRPSMKHPAWKGSAADNATPPFEFHDVIIATSDPDDPSKVVDLPADPVQPGQKNFFTFLQRMQTLAGDDVTVRVKRANGDVVDVKVPPAFHTTIGATMSMGQIVAIRKDSPAAKANVQLPRTVETGKKHGDLIEQVEVKDSKGKARIFTKETLNPERLPFELKEWARELVKAGKIEGATVKLTVRRHRDKEGADYEDVKIDMPWDNGWAFDRAIPASTHSAVAIPELGLAYNVGTTVVQVADATSSLKPRDIIKSVQVVYNDAEGNEQTSKWDDVDADSWAFMGLTFLQGPSSLLKVKLKVEHDDKKVEEIEISPTVDKAWPRAQRGWFLLPDTQMQRADTTLEAISYGLRDTGRSMKAILNGIRQMIVGRIDYKKQLGGPLSIMNIAYVFAGRDFWEFVFFLGLISVNLAVINFLPIPLLDGGHMVFLIYEKIRGKPASEGVRVAATYLGLAFIACLILLVTYLDIFRWFT